MKQLKFLFYLLVFITFIYILFNLNYAITNMSMVLINFFKSLLPYLFLFLIINQILIKTNLINLIGYLLQFIFYPLFKINAKTSSLLFISLINGFPSSVLYSSLMVKNKVMESDNTKNIALYFFLPSYTFIFYLVKNFLSPAYFIIFAIALYLPSFIFLLFKRNKSSDTYIKFDDLKKEIVTSFNNFDYINNLKSIFLDSIITLINILGMISFYSIITIIIPLPLIKGLFEFSMPSLVILKSNNTEIIKSLYLLIILVFSSISSISQASIYFNDLNLNLTTFIKTRIALLSLSLLIFNLCLFVYLL